MFGRYIAEVGVSGTTAQEAVIPMTRLTLAIGVWSPSFLCEEGGKQ